jgi:hypothetical protein
MFYLTCGRVRHEFQDTPNLCQARFDKQLFKPAGIADFARSLPLWFTDDLCNGAGQFNPTMPKTLNPSLRYTQAIEFPLY